MKHGIFTLSLRKSILIKDKDLLISFIFLAFGLVSGVIIFHLSRESISAEVRTMFLNFNNTFVKLPHSEIFAGIMSEGLLYFIVMYILGGSIFGKYLCPVLSAVKIAGISIVTSFLYASFGLKGFEYALLVVFPGKVIFLFAVLIMTKICIAYSRGVLCCDKSDFSFSLKSYCIKSSAVFVIFIFSWIVDFLCIIIFSDLFN